MLLHLLLEQNGRQLTYGCTSTAAMYSSIVLALAGTSCDVVHRHTGSSTASAQDSVAIEQQQTRVSHPRQLRPRRQFVAVPMHIPPAGLLLECGLLPAASGLDPATTQLELLYKAQTRQLKMLSCRLS